MKFLKSFEFKVWLKNSHNRILLGSVGFLAVLLLILTFTGKESKKGDPMTADTVIPAGFVLVPIELGNASSVGSLMGAFGVVDLFSLKTNSSDGKRVAHNVRLIRAPLNPDQFAALTPEAEAPLLLHSQGPLFAVLQNPDQKNKSDFTRKTTVSSQIEYFRGK